MELDAGLSRLLRHTLNAAAACLLAGGALFAVGGQALAYPPPGDTGGIVASCATTQSGQSCTVTFTLTAPNGQPAGGVLAVFSVNGCGSVSPTQGVTNSQGQVNVTYTPGSGCCGTATITATAPSVGVSAHTVINVACHSMLPTTSGSAAAPNDLGSPGVPAWAIAVFALAAFVLMAGGLALRATHSRV